MKPTVERPAGSAGERFRHTDVSPQGAFQALGRLRREARNEIDRLIAFLDATDPYVTTELEVDDGETGLGDLDGALEQVGLHGWQLGAMA